ncbi:MAG: hypothetical protein HUJ73_03520, partial [Eubacterium sp.]|nr:hypothetical protein [Eubacterium sp.]
DHICSDPNHKAAPNGGKEMVAFDLPAVTVSAAPKYNVTISEHQYKSCYGNFDFSTGNDKANNQDAGVVEGQLRGIGMYLSLRNDNPDKGFRGIELPNGDDITFDINLSALYTNETDPSITAGVTPLVWTVDANRYSNNTTSAYDGRAMNVGGTKTADTSLPYNKGTPSAYNFFCYNGGSWAAVQDEADPNVIHVTVKDYKINIDQFPTHNSGGTTTNMPTGAGVYWGAFSAGKLEYVIPNTTPEGQYIPTVYGNGTMKVTFYDVNLVAKSITDQETKTFLGREQTIYDESGKLTADDLRALNYPLRAGNGGFSQRIWYGTSIYAGDFNGLSNTTSGSCYQNGKDVGMPGQEGTIDWSVLWSANGSTENNLYAVDSLMLFDASAFEVRREPSVKSPNRDYGGNEFGSTAHMQYTFLYAAKPDGSNWTGIDEMNGTKIEDLVYYTSLNALLSDGKLCVGCLMQTRAKHYLNNASNSSSVTAALPVRIRTDESLLNNVYPTIVMSNIWWKSGTDKYTSEELKQEVVNNDKTSTGLNIPFITDFDEYTKALNYASGKNYRYAGNTYKPSVYEEGNWVDGHVPSGNPNGDSLYVVPYITTIGKFIDQTVTVSGVEKQKENFNLDYAQNVVDFRLEPALEVKHTTTTGGVTDVTVKETLPAGVAYNGDAVIGGVYVP